MNAPSSPYDSLVLSYLTLRKAVGILGISLPVVLAVGGTIFCGLELQRSISSYYYSLPAGGAAADPTQPVTATTPIWRDIAISDVTAMDAFTVSAANFQTFASHGPYKWCS